MSTELKPTSNLSMTQFSNRERAGKNQLTPLCLQLTQGLGGIRGFENQPGFVNLNRQEAAELFAALAEWLAGTRQEDEYGAL